MSDPKPEHSQDHLESRPPQESDLAALCQELNTRGAKYIVIGGFAVMAAGFPRATGDIDMIVDSGLENESRVFAALASLPDRAVDELGPGELEKYTVIRVADEIVVDLMISAGGISYNEACQDVVIRTIQGVSIPFASPRLLWKMKSVTHREKDSMDLIFLRQWFSERGENPPPTRS